ncbi:C2 domain-containing protein, partial [Haematococcus lacustris]
MSRCWEEADVLRQFLVSLQAMFEDEHSGSPASRTLAASSLGADAAAVRTGSTSYASALLQAAMADSADLQDFYSVQLSCLQHARLTPRDAGNVFVELGPQQLPLVDLLRILRQRRKAEASTQAFVTDRLREASAIITQVVFGLVSSERVVSEVRCCLPGPGAVRAGGRLVITQHVACFTTMLDSDLRGTTDTTFTLMRNKQALMGATQLAVRVATPASNGAVLLFVGIPDALLASLKQRISDLVTQAD